MLFVIQDNDFLWVILASPSSVVHVIYVYIGIFTVPLQAATDIRGRAGAQAAQPGPPKILRKKKKKKKAASILNLKNLFDRFSTPKTNLIKP
jgi:hypothetical protein